MEDAPKNEIEKIVLTVLREVMNDSSIEASDDFFSVGGDSKKAIQFLNVLREKELYLSLGDFFACRTVKELAEKVTCKKIDYHKLIDKVIDSIQIREELIYDKDRTNLSESCEEEINEEKKYSDILLTGATGYLGSYIAQQLLSTTESLLFLLVRGENEEACKERVKSIWSNYHEEDLFKKYENRIRIIPSDVSKKKFGLKPTEYNCLAEKIDCIIHSAAVVSHVEKWEKYETININGTENILKFAMYVRKKDVNYISTIATEITRKRLENMKVFDEKIIEDDSSDILYVQSKIECEKMLEAYRKKGCGVKIFRMGFLVQNYKTGKFQINAQENGFFRILSMLNEMKAFPNVKQNMIDLTYVDEAAEAVVKLFARKDNLNIYHIFNPDRISIGEMGAAIKEINPEIKLLELEDYREFLYDNCDKFRDLIEKMTLILMLDTSINLNIFGVSNNEKTMKRLNDRDFLWHSFDAKVANDIYKIIEMGSKE